MNKLIIETLKPLNIPVKFQIYSGSSTPYITFFTTNEVGELYADDKEIATSRYIQLDIFSKESYTELVNKTNKLMKKNGFIRRPAGPEIYEHDTKLYHKILRFFFCIENEEEI